MASLSRRASPASTMVHHTTDLLLLLLLLLLLGPGVESCAPACPAGEVWAVGPGLLSGSCCPPGHTWAPGGFRGRCVMSGGSHLQPAAKHSRQFAADERAKKIHQDMKTILTIHEDMKTILTHLKKNESTTTKSSTTSTATIKTTTSIISTPRKGS